jgi:translation initiation factor IF-2
MAEQAQKKIKIYKLATELNLASETIIEFLKKKGFDVKSHMSTVSDEMLRAITSHFKKEKDVAERHQRKIQEFRSSRKKEGVEKPEKQGPVEEEKKPEKVEEREPVVEEVATAPAEEKESPVEEKPALAEESPGAIPAEEEALESQETAAKEVPAKKATPAERRKRGPQSPLEVAVARAPRGLMVKGKMEIARAGEGAAEADGKKPKKKKKKLREEVKKVKTAPAVGDDEDGKAKGRKKKKTRHAAVNEVEVAKAIRETLAGMEDTSASARAAARKRKKTEREEEDARLIEEQERLKTHVRVTEFVTVGELANLMRVSVAEVIQKCMSLGIMASINQRLDKDTIQILADEFGFQIDFEEEFAPEALVDEEDDVETLQHRSPVVTIMGHVDHGKTSLLDDGKHITFLDTPGHEAFTAMRARGAQVTDIVVLVVAADDNVMPQTAEAISHAQAAGVPIVIAINKVDKPTANAERIRQQLSDKGVLVEEWGGKYQAVELSAKTGQNVHLMLEKILLEAEVLDLKANPNRRARGVVIEAQLDRGKGTVATVLVQKGTLRIGDSFVCGIWSGRVRAMFDERGNRVEAAKPSQPVQIIGFDGIPQAGDVFIVLPTEREAREISIKRQQLKREQDFRQRRMVTLDDISKQIQEGQIKDLPIIVKGDVDGSVEALSDALMKLSTGEVNVQVIHKGVGGISETDVLLAAASRAVIIGFHVRPNLNARRLAEQEDVEIRLYNIIYDAINDVRSALEGMLSPTISEEVTATVEVRDTFKIPRIGTIAGFYVKDGKIVRNNRVRLVRDGVVVFEGTIASLKRFKEDVREVEQSFECGIGLEGFNDVKVGDIIEAFKMVETKRKLGQE